MLPAFWRWMFVALLMSLKWIVVCRIMSTIGDFSINTCLHAGRRRSRPCPYQSAVLPFRGIPLPALLANNRFSAIAPALAGTISGNTSPCICSTNGCPYLGYWNLISCASLRTDIVYFPDGGHDFLKRFLFSHTADERNAVDNGNFELAL